MATVGPLSYSGIRAYLECPLRWKFLYIDRLTESPRPYFTFGRTVHTVLEELLEPLVVPAGRRLPSGSSQRTLEDFHPERDTGTGRLLGEEELRALYDRHWSSEGFGSHEEETRYRELGWSMLRTFRSAVADAPPSPVAVEPHLEAVWDGIPVHGYIDRIDRTETGGLEVLDYKTSKELREADARESDQLTLYQVLVEANLTGSVERLTLFHLRRQQALRSERRGRPALEELYDRVGQVHDGIRTEAYEPRPGRQCGRCEFQPRCPEFRSVPVPEADRLRQLADRFARLRSEEGRLEEELRATARELHHEAERHGVHRVPGSREVLLRRSEEEWTYPEEAVRGALERAGWSGPLDIRDAAAVRRWLRDPSVPAELRRRVAESGERKVRHFWTSESAEPRP